MSVDEVVKHYGMIPHPEGGWFVQWYASPVMLSKDLPSDNYAPGSVRYCSTAILYMCLVGGRSALHKISADEMWMWHSGCPLTVVELIPPERPGADAGVKKTKLGPDFAAGQTFVHTVKAGTYFGAYCTPDDLPGSSALYSLVTCVVSPGFDYRDWAMQGESALRAAFPGPIAEGEIERLALPDKTS